MDEPIRPIEKDGIYSRCVWCDAEIYGPGVFAYSQGKNGCHACGRLLPDDYVKASETKDDK